LVGKPEGKRPLERLRIKWEVNNRIDVRDIGLEGEDWSHVTQCRDQLRDLVNALIKLWVP
jgi:hypothetical protein